MIFLPLLLLLLLPLLLFGMEGNWRGCLLYTVVIGFLQDPLRKITPDQPAFFVGLALLGLLVAALTLFQREGSINLSSLFSGNRRLPLLIEILTGVVALQSVIAILNSRPFTVVGIGIGFYVAPLIAAWIGYYLALVPTNVTRFLRLYVGLAVLFAVSLLVSYSGVQSSLFSEVGPGVQIHIAELGKYVQGFCGLWRSSELAAWSLGAACCFVMILGISTRNPKIISIATLLMTSLLVIGTLTGRRKIVVLVLSFLALYAFLITWRGDSRSKSSVFIGIASAGLLFTVLSISLNESVESGSLGVFLRRSGSVWEQLGERWQQLGTNVIGAALNDSGFFGSGVGAAAQGARSLGLETGLSSWTGESGLGKITLELGLPGLVCILMIVVSLALHYLSILRLLLQAPPSYRLLNIGLIAFLISNIPNFIVASQVYGDPFVLIVLGLVAGFILAAPAVVFNWRRTAAIHSVSHNALVRR